MVAETDGVFDVVAGLRVRETSAGGRRREEKTFTLLLEDSPDWAVIPIPDHWLCRRR